MPKDHDDQDTPVQLPRPRPPGAKRARSQPGVIDRDVLVHKTRLPPPSPTEQAESWDDVHTPVSDPRDEEDDGSGYGERVTQRASGRSWTETETFRAVRRVGKEISGVREKVGELDDTQRALAEAFAAQATAIDNLADSNKANAAAAKENAQAISNLSGEVKALGGKLEVMLPLLSDERRRLDSIQQRTVSAAAVTETIVGDLVKDQIKGNEFRRKVTWKLVGALVAVATGSVGAWEGIKTLLGR
jgi:hypothetical protein